MAKMVPVHPDMWKQLQHERTEMRLALEAIGKNTCGREPLAAAYARGVLSELASPVTPMTTPYPAVKGAER